MSCRLPAVAYAAVIAVLALFVAPSSPAAADTALFASLAGQWSGSGALKLSSGEKERLRCKGRYNVLSEGKTLEQHLRCASDSYRFDVDSTISYNPEAGVLSGNWAETNYGLGGFVSGRLTGSRMQIKVDGGSFTAAIGISISGDQQAVTIRSDATISEVSLTLKRA